jgi:hypothetical protein
LTTLTVAAAPEEFWRTVVPSAPVLRELTVADADADTLTGLATAVAASPGLATLRTEIACNVKGAFVQAWVASLPARVALYLKENASSNRPRADVHVLIDAATARPGYSNLSFPWVSSVGASEYPLAPRLTTAPLHAMAHYRDLLASEMRLKEGCSLTPAALRRFWRGVQLYEPALVPHCLETQLTMSSPPKVLINAVCFTPALLRHPKSTAARPVWRWQLLQRHRLVVMLAALRRVASCLPTELVCECLLPLVAVC